MDEGTDTSPGKPGDTLDQFLVLIDAIVSSRLRLVEAGQQEGRGKPGNGLGSACCHGYVSAEARECVCRTPIRTGTLPKLPVHPWSASGVHTSYQKGGLPRQPAKPIHCLAAVKQ